MDREERSLTGGLWRRLRQAAVLYLIICAVASGLAAAFFVSAEPWPWWEITEGRELLAWHFGLTAIGCLYLANETLRPKQFLSDVLLSFVVLMCAAGIPLANLFVAFEAWDTPAIEGFWPWMLGIVGASGAVGFMSALGAWDVQNASTQLADRPRAIRRRTAH